MSYRPHPIDTSTIELTPGLAALVEQLAKNVHDLWAQRRLGEGWRHGPQRDDTKKEHPGLIPYEQLSETEKDYDRQTVIGTLKLITALGYGIELQRRGAGG